MEPPSSFRLGPSYPPVSSASYPNGKDWRQADMGLPYDSPPIHSTSGAFVPFKEHLLSKMEQAFLRAQRQEWDFVIGDCDEVLRFDPVITLI